MPYDATKMKDWQISEAAEVNMPTPWEFQEKLGLKKDEILPDGPALQARFHENHRAAQEIVRTGNISR